MSTPSATLPAATTTAPDTVWWCDICGDAAAAFEIGSCPTCRIATIQTIADEVFAVLGAGHTESVYHNAMKIGVQDAGLKFETERDLPIQFRGRYVGTVRADLIVDKRLVLEFKAGSGTDGAVQDAEEQCRLYMKETQIRYGLVIVFPKRDGKKVLFRVVS